MELLSLLSLIVIIILTDARRFNQRSCMFCQTQRSSSVWTKASVPNISSMFLLTLSALNSSECPLLPVFSGRTRPCKTQAAPATEDYVALCVENALLGAIMAGLYYAIGHDDDERGICRLSAPEAVSTGARLLLLSPITFSFTLRKIVALAPCPCLTILRISACISSGTLCPDSAKCRIVWTT